MSAPPNPFAAGEVERHHDAIQRRAETLRAELAPLDDAQLCDVIANGDSDRGLQARPVLAARSEQAEQAEQAARLALRDARDAAARNRNELHQTTPPTSSRGAHTEAPGSPQSVRVAAAAAPSAAPTLRAAHRRVGRTGPPAHHSGGQRHPTFADTEQEAIDDMRSALFGWAYFSLVDGQEPPELPG